VVLNCTVDHILQGFYTLFLTRFRTYKIASPPQTKITSKDDIKGLGIGVLKVPSSIPHSVSSNHVTVCTSFNRGTLTARTILSRLLSSGDTTFRDRRPCTTACPGFWAMGTHNLKKVTGEEKNILYWADQSSKGTIKVSCAGMMSLKNQTRKDPFHVYSLSTNFFVLASTVSMGHPSLVSLVSTVSRGHCSLVSLVSTVSRGHPSLVSLLCSFQHTALFISKIFGQTPVCFYINVCKDSSRVGNQIPYKILLYRK
jgi:hypothetical protein